MVAPPLQNRPPLRPRVKLAALLLLVLVVASVVGNRGLIRVYRMHQTRATLERENAQLTASNAALEDQVRALRTEPGQVEAIAREELGLVKPGELVYEFRQEPRPPQPPDVR